jgi:hypothetical protein
VPSHLYSLSFAPRADWSRRFAPQAEIHQYLRDVTRDFDVLRHIRFGTEVLAAAFDEDSGTWRLRLPGGAGHEADVFNRRHRPAEPPEHARHPRPGRFEGTLFHSARWDHGHDLTSAGPTTSRPSGFWASIPRGARLDEHSFITRHRSSPRSWRSIRRSSRGSAWPAA